MDYNNISNMAAVYDENSNLQAMFNHLMNVKDSRWLQLEVCREFQRGQCSRTDAECKFAHPPPWVEVNNGRVTACYDSIKGKCTRENPKCKYLHPPQNLKDQLLINGRNNLALKNLLMAQLSNSAMGTGQAVAVAAPPLSMPAGAMGMMGVPQYQFPGAYASHQTVLPGMLHSAASPDAYQSLGGVVPGSAPSPASLAAAATAAAQAQARAKTDRVEVCREFLRGSCQRAESDCKFAHPPPEAERATDGTVTVCMDFVRATGRPDSCQRNPCRYFHPPAHLLTAVRAKLSMQNGASQENGELVPVLQGAPLHNANATVNNMQASIMQQSTSSALPTVSTVPSSASPLVKMGKKRVHEEQQHQQLQPQMSPASVAQLSLQAAAAASYPHLLSQQMPCGQPQPQAQYDPNTSLLLAAAAYQQQQQQQQLAMTQAAQGGVKRVAVEKSGLPVYQPTVSMANMGYPAIGAFQYPQFAFPGFQQAYIPAVSFGMATGCTNGVMGTVHTAAPATMAPVPQNRMPNNTASVAYFDESGQLLDTLPVCRDYKQGHCERPNCRYVHLLEDYVEVHDGKVTVCRDYAKGKCTRVACKYYHVPVVPGSLLLNRLMAPSPMEIPPAIPSSQIYYPATHQMNGQMQQTALLLAQQQQVALASHISRQPNALYNATVTQASVSSR